MEGWSGCTGQGGSAQAVRACRWVLGAWGIMVKPAVGTAVFDPGHGLPMASLLPEVERGGMKSETFHLRQVSVCTAREVGLVSEICRRQSSGSKLVKNHLLCFEQILFLSAAQIPQVLDSGKGMLLRRRSGYHFSIL